VSTYQETSFVRAPPGRLFDLVADVERYPEFLALWRWARVIERDPAGYVTDQEIGLGLICEHFRTRTILDRPRRIEVKSDDPMFRNFLIEWNFAEHEEGCLVGIHLCWEVRSRLLQGGIDAMLPFTARSMVLAFDRRASRVNCRT
jgi:coenzyme Q-binding protein COQ10